MRALCLGDNRGTLDGGIELWCAILQNSTATHLARQSKCRRVTADNQSMLDFRYLFERGQNMLEQVTIQAGTLIFRQHTSQTRFSAPQWFYRDDGPNSHKISIKFSTP